MTVPPQELTPEHIEILCEEIFADKEFVGLRKILSQLQLTDREGGGPRLQASDYFGSMLLLPGVVLTKSEATKGKRALELAIGKLKLARTALRAASARVRAIVDESSDLIRHEGNPDAVTVGGLPASTIDLLDRLIIGLDRQYAWIDGLIAKWDWTGAGADPDMRARHVAVAIAQLYMRLRPGESPSISLNDEATTLYCRVVKEVFEHLGIKTSFRKPCEFAYELIEAGTIDKYGQRPLGKPKPRRSNRTTNSAK